MASRTRYFSVPNTILKTKLANLTQNNCPKSSEITSLSKTKSLKGFHTSHSKPYNHNTGNENSNTSTLAYWNSTKQGKSRKRQIIWFTPLFSLRVYNIPRQFFNILKPKFPKHYKYYTIFNKDTVKMLYSTNLSSIIVSTNGKIQNYNNKSLNPETLSITPNSLFKGRNVNRESISCSCRNPELCPLSGQCQQKRVIYKCVITNDKQKTRTYI